MGIGGSSGRKRVAVGVGESEWVYEGWRKYERVAPDAEGGRSEGRMVRVGVACTGRETKCQDRCVKFWVGVGVLR